MYVNGPVSQYRKLEIYLVVVDHLHLLSFVSDIFLIMQEQPQLFCKFPRMGKFYPCNQAKSPVIVYTTVQIEEESTPLLFT